MRGVGAPAKQGIVDALSWSTHAGEITAALTAGCWACTAIAFEAAGLRIGSMAVNFWRLVIGLALLSVYGWIARGQPLPLDATPQAWGWLSASSVAGLVIGDMCLFRAFVVLGPRLSSLIMSTAPVFTALFGWKFLGETMTWTHVGGMTAVTIGIAWAVTSRPRPGGRAVAAPSAKGVALAFGGSIGQASGLVLSKYGMADYDAFAATQIRVIAAIACFVVLLFVVRRYRQVFAGLRDRLGVWYTSVGAVFGPFLGVSLSLYAVQHTTAGTAASIMATTPIVILPMVMIRGERVPLGGILGAVLTVGGVILLFQ